MAAAGSDAEAPPTVIVGAGVVGCSVAYFLAKRGHRTLVVEQCGVACAASGKAGGFLARNWSQGSPLDELARTSFDLHAQLAQELAAHADVGYRRANTYSVECSEEARRRKQSSKKSSGGRDAALDWFDGLEASVDSLGTEETTAQVHPRLLTQALLNEAVRTGCCELRIARVSGIQIDNGKVVGVGLEGSEERVAATRVVVAMGPWTHTACDWLPIPRVVGRKAQSAVFSAELPATPCFVYYTDSSGKTHDPEIYPRPDGTVYVCDSCSQVPVPNDPNDIWPTDAESDELVARARRMTSRLQVAEVLIRQACYLPVSDANDGLPLIGPVPGVEGAYLATAHSCWGILLGPATGLAMSELILDGQASSVDLSPFALA